MQKKTTCAKNCNQMVQALWILIQTWKILKCAAYMPLIYTIIYVLQRFVLQLLLSNTCYCAFSFTGCHYHCLCLSKPGLLLKELLKVAVVSGLFQSLKLFMLAAIMIIIISLRTLMSTCKCLLVWLGPGESIMGSVWFLFRQTILSLVY